jgi:hypothetical protein
MIISLLCAEWSYPNPKPYVLGIKYRNDIERNYAPYGEC